MVDTPPLQQALIVGIDFGTTYSKVAWAHTSSPDKVQVIDKWPTQGSALSDGNQRKVKTELIYYEKNGTKFYKWGAQIGANARNRLSWFKLLLDDRRARTPRIIHARRDSTTVNAGDGPHVDMTNGIANDLEDLRLTIAAMPRDKKPVDLVTDYLTGVHSHIMDTLNNTYKREFIAVNPIHYSITVPAIWSDTARSLTLEAAKRAGLGDEKNIKVVTEPEAAAICVLKAYKEAGNCLKIGDVYVIADCGGGTADLISYQITSLEPLGVVECVMGSGDFCGSTFIDRAFIKFLKERIGPQTYDRMTDHARFTTKNAFEGYKASFSMPDNSDEDDEFDLSDVFPCSVPGVPDNGESVVGGCLVLTREDMKSLFQPVLTRITDLVQNQVTAAEEMTGKDVTAILLVGGLGSSQYLKQHLENSIRSSNGDKVYILQPPDALTAIVQGAVHYGMSHTNMAGKAQTPGMVESRIAKFSYGINVMHPFIPFLHSLRNVIINPLDGQLYCAGRTCWFVKKGDTIIENKPIIRRVYQNRKATEEVGEYKFPEEIICSDADTPPEYSDDPSILTLLTYNIDLSGEDPSTFKCMEARLIDGEFYQIEFDMVMRRESALFEFWSERDGRRVGEGKVEYNHEKPRRH